MLTFGNPIFLWGLLGLAAPILIHLIQRDIFRPLRFPSIRFIRRGAMPVERKKRLRDLPLLLLRMLLFAAIITALARPEWQPEAMAAESEQEELVLVLDISASMSGWGSLEEARREALTRLEEHAGQPAALVLSSDRAALTVPMTLDHSEIRRAIESAEPDLVAGRHRPALQEAAGLFSGPGAGRLMIFSDFQLSDWSPGALPDLSAAAEIEWVKVGRERDENSAIVSARTFPMPDGRRQVIADLRNFGESEATRTLELTAGGSRIANREIRLLPGQQQTETFIISEDTPNRAQLRLSPADSFPADDTYHLWLGEPPPARFLLVAPIEEEPLKAREVFFLQRALGARTEAEWLAFSPQFTEPAGLTEAAIENAAAVILLGAASYLDSGQWRSLREFASHGGMLLLTPGNAPGRQFAQLRDHGFINLGVAGTVELDRNRRLPYSVDWVDPESGLASLFREEAARSLYNIHFYRYLRLENRDDRASMLLQSDADDALLFEKPIDRGRLLVSAFAFDPEWSDFPITGAFLPMIRELVSGHLSTDEGILQVETGVATEALREQLALVPDDVLSGINTRTPGVHLAGEVPVVINLSRAESTPATAATLDLSAAAIPGTTRTTATAGAGEPANHPLWPWVALAALLLFLLEMPVAALLRRRSAARQSAAVTPPVNEPASEPVEATR
jgi:hypothetical protein